MPYVLAGIVIVLMALGQLMFKRVGSDLGAVTGLSDGSLRNSTVLVFVAALVLYFGATILWILVLRDLPLSKAYPVMALTYLLVPLGSRFYLGEPLSSDQLLGLALIVGGVALAAK